MFPVEAFEQTLTKLVSVLDRLSIPFHLTGGITSVAYGEPRLTQDIDLVIDNPAARSRIDAFIDGLERTGFQFDERSVREAVGRRGSFQLFDRVEALKLDVYPRELVPGELSRSVSAEVFEGVHLPLACREDAAVSKLIWVRRGSTKSRRDFRQIFRSSNPQQQATIRELCEQLELSDVFDEVLSENDEIVEE